ncbi:hypothetical protein BJ170DRAFT_6852 [Xylariales sp. AK1849]|nr:hypothetical protein BJ170DRAFT_6852 [Xylariales sp. AK1849]
MERVAELQSRLAVLQDAVAQLREHIDRLANFDFQPGSVPLGAGDDNVSNELSSEIIQILREQEEDLELLQEEVIDIRPLKYLEHDKDRLRDGAERLKGELHSCQILLRKAQISAKENLQRAQKRERELLWASFSQPRSARGSGASSPLPAGKPRRKQRSEMSKDEQQVAASSDVTQALRRTHDMMASELSRSDFARKTLQESTAALSQLSESYSSLDTLLSSSRDLLATLMRSQKSDTWYLETSFYMLAVTIGWLSFRRFLYGPMWWLVWLPLKLIFRVGVTLTNTVGHHGGNDVMMEAPGAQPASPQLNNDDIPTIQVGHPQETRKAATDQPAEDSLVDEIGRMMDESNEGADILNDALQDGSKEGDKILDDAPHDDSENNEYKEFLDHEAELSRQIEEESVRVEL